MELKRDFVKYVRDGGKSLYKKDSQCRICGNSTELQFHHTKSVALVVDKWLSKKGYTVSTAEDAFYYRDLFILDHQKELYDDTLTLCKTHHKELHQVYGKAPGLGTSEKQRRWVEKQRIKHGLE